MADQFPCSCGNSVEEPPQRGCIQGAGREYTDGSVGCYHSGLFYLSEKRGFQNVKNANFKAAECRSIRSSSKSPVWLEGVAHGMHPTALGCPQQGAQYSRKHMRMFVGVNVRDSNAGLLQALDLGGGFGFDILFVHPV